MKLKATIEYVGESFSGFQAQGPELLTVQGDLERALGVVLSSWHKKQRTPLELQAPLPQITGSGRTDAGVHAKAQVVSFNWPEELQGELPRLMAALNGITSPALSVLKLEAVADDFDARHTPHRKVYSYRFVLARNSFGLAYNRAWYVGSKLDLQAMILAARLFRGQHDFSAFRAADCTAKSTIRSIISSELTRIDDRTLLYTIEGRGFLKQMVRIIAGTLVAVGRGELTQAEVEELIQGGERRNAGGTAPACGLTLERVDYLERDYFDRLSESPAKV